MDHRAHGLDLTHPVFNTPKKVAFEWEDETPHDEYIGETSIRYPDGVGKTYKTTAFDKVRGAPNAIAVDHEGIFADVPHLESIAEGCAHKSLGSLSLARQGRYFFWGFCIDPDRMTDASKAVFTNALHYLMTKRNCETVTYTAIPREMCRTYVRLHRVSGYTRGLLEHLPKALDEASKAKFPKTVEGAKEWIEAHIDYLYGNKESTGEDLQAKRRKMALDAEAMTLKTPNFKRESLETWMELAKGGDKEKKPLALVCLSRYVHPDIAPKDGDWAKWYAEFRDKIVFIESAGFWWQVAPKDVTDDDPSLVKAETPPKK